jgi:hypothetical protein
LFSHIGYEISKKRKKKVLWASRGHETQFRSKFDPKLSFPLSFLFLNAFKQSLLLLCVP